MAYMLAKPETAFRYTGGKKKRPRREEADYLKAIRELPCLVCGGRPVEAAHIRTAAPERGKRETGLAEKSDDRWTLPLCPTHHKEQHTGNELAFYREYGIDPFVTALALWGCRDDEEAMLEIVKHARRPG